MGEMTQEEALRQAAGLVSQALKEVEARCGVLAQYVNDCESASARTAAWGDAIRELRTLQDYRAGLVRRRSLIQQALDCLTGESPAHVPLPRPPARTGPRAQRQVQIPVRRRS